MASKESVARVREFYELGTELCDAVQRAERRTGSVYSRAIVPKIAKKKKVSAAMAYRAKQLAEVYTKAEVEKLARRGVTKSHFLMLLEIEDERLRQKLTEGCVNGWTTRELELERQRVKPRKSDGRSPVLKPLTRKQAAPEVKRRTKSWVRWTRSVKVGDLPQRSRKAFREAQDAMRELVESL